NLRLVGLCSEPVATRGGWAGVATWLADAHGRLWSLSDVQPGGVERVLQAWRGGVRLGDLSLAHAELVRAGALVQDATASADGRLGAGAAVQAVRAAGATWDQTPLASLFARPLADQVATALAPGSAGLLTLAGRLVGGCLRLEGGHRLGLVPALADPALPALANLRALAAADLAVRAVVRPLREAAGQAALLALAPADDGLRLPEAMAGRLMAALEHLPHAGLANGQGGPAADEDPPLPWATLERRALAVLLGGRSALPASVGPGLAAEARNLRAQLCGAAAARLESLFQACQAVPGERWGRLAQVPPAAFARQWAAAALQAQRAREQHARDAWTRWADPASC
ncbi:MAG: hypothetical protein L6R48_03715, partial [Planctomycetes bacterium]|nr:hypothetical protein [Planctomycetota bacterium]